MVRSLALAAAVCLAAGAAPAQIAPAKSKPKAPAKKAAPKPAETKAPPATAVEQPATASAPAASPDVAKPPAAFDQEEFRRQVMEEVRRELQKTKDEVKQETAWVEQDSQARVQDSEAVEQLKQRVNLFQPHGYLRMRGEFFSNMGLGRGADPAGYSLFPGPFIGTGGNNSQSDVNFRFRFEPTLEVSEDLAVYGQLDVLDNILLGTDPVSDLYIDPNTPLSVMANNRGAGVVKVKRLWGRVNTQLGELVFGRMGYHWGLGILHNDGNCLDCDYGDTYDRIAFTPREFKGHHFSLMFDILAKGQTTTGEHGELGRSVDLDTLDDGYRLGLEITRLDNAEEIKRKLDADLWIINYGILADYRTQPWDTPITNGPNQRANVVRRAAKFYQPDVFVALKRKKWRLDAEVTMTYGTVGSHEPPGVDQQLIDPQLYAQLTQPISFLQFGGALQTDIALLPADAVLLGLELGGASGDKGAYGFGARPWRSGCLPGTAGGGTPQPVGTGQAPYCSAGPGDIDGGHLDYNNLDASHGRINNFVFNRAFNVDMILWRNLITSVTSGWYVKPSIRYRPTGRKSGGGDDTGFELLGAVIYSQAWYPENTPGLALNVGITYDTSDRLHTGLAYGLLLPFSGLQNTVTGQSGSLAHALRFIMAIPF
jgi:uncharacterized protein (TIGR04551 family)